MQEQGGKTHLIDFWVRSQESEALLVLRDESPLTQIVTDGVPVPVHSLPLAEIAAARVWIDNWERMPPCIIAGRQFITDGLGKTILEFIVEPMPYGQNTKTT